MWPHGAWHCHGSWSVFPRRQLTASYSVAKDRYGEQWGTVRCNVWPTFHGCWTSPLTCYTLQLYKPLHHGSPIEATSQLSNSALICIMQNPQNVFGRQETSVRLNVLPVTRCRLCTDMERDEHGLQAETKQFHHSAVCTVIKCNMIAVLVRFSINEWNNGIFSNTSRCYTTDMCVWWH